MIWSNLLLLLTIFIGHPSKDDLLAKPELSEKPKSSVYHWPSKIPLNQIPFEDFTQYQNVLPDYGTFISPGHANERVRVLFNQISLNAFTGDCEIPFPEGTVIAKAFVSHTDQKTLDAKNIHIMRKMHKGFYPKGDDWEYAVIDRDKSGKFYWDTVGKITSCRVCHAQYAQYDYVFTIERFRDYNTWYGGIQLFFEDLF